MYQRIVFQRQALRRGKHHNEALQHDWNEEGETAFECHLVQIVLDANRRLLTEKRIIMAQDEHLLYNDRYKQTEDKLKRRSVNNRPERKLCIYLPPDYMDFMRDEAKRRRVSCSKLIQDGLNLLRREQPDDPR